MVDGQRFHGKGKDRRIAKTKAAQAALTQLFEMDFSSHHVDSIPYIPIVTDDQQVGIEYVPCRFQYLGKLWLRNQCCKFAENEFYSGTI